MKYIRFKTYTGAQNMQIDSDLLDEAIKNQSTEPVFRLYGWSPKCVSLGRNQKELAIPEGLDCVRRLTGGRALLHDDEVTYSYVAPAGEGESVIESYKKISGILIDFFKTLGIDLNYGGGGKSRGKSGDKSIGGTKFDYCMLLSTGADVCYQGKKLIGSAQCRKNGYILQHGSILFDYDKEFLENIFHEEVKGITCVKEILPEITKEELIHLLQQHLQRDMCAETYQTAE